MALTNTAVLPFVACDTLTNRKKRQRQRLIFGETDKYTETEKDLFAHRVIT